MTPEEFNSRFFPYAQAVSARTGLDPRLVLAQAALETGYGKSAPNMNYFGIKSHGRAGGQTLQTSEFENGRMVSQPASFRAYESPEQSFQGYADFLLTNPRYKGVLAADGLENQIAAMAKSGYATDPNYGAKLASIAGVAGGNDMLTGGGGSMSLLGGAGNDTGGGLAMENDQGGLFGFLGDREQRARLGLALMGMSMHPNEGAMAMARDTIAQAQAARENQFAQAETAKAENRTLEYIANLGTPQAQRALAYAQGTGDVAGALKMAMETTPAPDLPASVDEYKFAVTQGYTGTFFDYQKEMADAKRAQTNVTVGGASEYGTIPQGYMMVTDPVTGAKSLAPIPGGPAAIEAEAEEAKAAQRRGMADAATQTIVSTAAKAREAAEARTLTGPLGSLAAFNPATQNAEMYRQVESLKSQAALENINAMRDASPTGGALGGATDADMLLLREKSGALDPRSPNFLRDLDDYELTLLQTIHGFAAGTQVFNQTRGGSAGTDSGTNIGDVSVGEPY